MKVGTPFSIAAGSHEAHLLNPLAWLLWTLDFALWVISLGPIRLLLSLVRKPVTVRVGDAWRLAETEHALVSTPFVEVRTIHDLVQRSCAKYPDRTACGTRSYLGEHDSEHGKFPLKKFGATHWTSYRELGRKVAAFGAGLVKLGLQPAMPGAGSSQDMLLIFEETSETWATACLGAFSQSLVVVTCYATLGKTAVAEAVAETGAKIVLCNVRSVAEVASACQGRCPSLEYIVYSRHCAHGSEIPQDSDMFGFSATSVEDVVELGASTLRPPTPPAADHLAVVMYTSGSTGKPKGVMIKHSSAVASVASVSAKFQTLGCKEGGETYIAYLPAAHILELMAELSMFSLGCAVGFACPKTISSKGACRVRPDGVVNTKPGYPYPPGAIQEFRPTVMVAVPKIWDILKKGVEEVLGNSSAAKQFLFRVAYAGRFWALQQGRDSPLFKAIVFRTLSNMLGGRLKIGITGGGPISADVQNFIRVAFAMPLLQGYALTETSCAGTVQMIDDVRCGVVGPPLASVEIKLRSCVGADGEPEVKDSWQQPYLASDTSHGGQACIGRGEVMIRGPSVSSGYFARPDLTAEAFDADGWFRTGDVGLMTPDGALRLVDRLKNLVKLKGGEYIALEAMEKEYSASAWVDGITGGVLCYGDGTMDRPVALVQVNVKALQSWALGAGREGKSAEELCKDPVAEKLVLKALHAAAEGRLAATEKIVALALLPGIGPMDGVPTAASPWTAENGCLTASNKMNRQQIHQACAALLEPLKQRAAR